VHHPPAQPVAAPSTRAAFLFRTESSVGGRGLRPCAPSSSSSVRACTPLLFVCLRVVLCSVAVVVCSCCALIWRLCSVLLLGSSAVSIFAWCSVLCWSETATWYSVLPSGAGHAGALFAASWYSVLQITRRFLQITWSAGVACLPHPFDWQAKGTQESALFGIQNNGYWTHLHSRCLSQHCSSVLGFGFMSFFSCNIKQDSIG